jgi:phosphatidylglycerophosphate synthase
MDRERLQRIRNFQSSEWYAALIVRPITILVMLVIADWRWVTPNRLTTAANVCKLGGAALILDPSHWVAAALLLQLGVLFDHLDGTIARYRRTFTRLGSFYDKVSDMVTWTVIMMAAGWQVYRANGEAYYLVLAGVSAMALATCGYMKWLVQAETERVRWLEARPDPAAAVARRTGPIVIAPPPTRTRRQWLGWFATMLSRVWRCEEVDLWFWLGLALVIDHLPWALWLMFVSQLINMVVMSAIRTRDIVRADRRIRELES